MLARERPTLARRGFLSGLAALPVAAAVPAPLAVAAATVDAEAMWANRMRCVDAYRGTEEAYQRADDMLPWWAKAGPSFQRPDGSIHSHSASGPAAHAHGRSRCPRPVAADTSGLTAIAEHDVDPASDIERHFTMTFRNPNAARQEARRRHAEALAAWEAEGERLANGTGTPEAAALCDALFDRLQDATDTLATMAATSPAGMAAKAGAFLALMETRQGAEEWETALALSLARDAVRIGAGAA